MENSISSQRGMLLAQWLADKRKEKGLTSQQLADALKVPQSLVSKVENCVRRLDIIEYMHYCEALDVDPRDAFLYLENQKYIQDLHFGYKNTCREN